MCVCALQFLPLESDLGEDDMEMYLVSLNCALGVQYSEARGGGVGVHQGRAAGESIPAHCLGLR